MKAIRRWSRGQYVFYDAFVFVLVHLSMLLVVFGAGGWLRTFGVVLLWAALYVTLTHALNFRVTVGSTPWHALRALGALLGLVAVEAFNAWQLPDAFEPYVIVRWAGMASWALSVPPFFYLTHADARRNHALVAASVALTLALLESVARAVTPAPLFDPSLPFIPNQSAVRTFPDVPGIKATDNRYTTNALGLRGDAPPDDFDAAYTILAVGASTTQSVAQSDEDVWTALLQTNLRDDRPDVWVGNAGLSGHTSAAHIVVLESVGRALRPDAVTLLVGINDVGLAIDPRFQRVADNQRRPLYAQTRLFQLASATFGSVRGDDGTLYNWTPTPLDDDAVLRPVPDDLREWLPTLDTYRANLERMAAITAEWDAETLFLTQPMLYENTPYWSGYYAEMPWHISYTPDMTAATYAAMLDIINAETLAFCNANPAVGCYDLAEAIPHDPAYFYDPVHYTDAGAALVAEQVTWAAREYFSLAD
jgi:lysophospholipase L1-like esterase